MTDQPTGNDAAAEALHALVSRSAAAPTSGFDEPAFGHEPGSMDSAATSASAANSTDLHGGAPATPFSNIPRLADSDDGEARMPANRMRPPPLGARAIRFIEPRAPKPVVVKSLNGNGVAVVEEPPVEELAHEAIKEEVQLASNDATDELFAQTEVISETTESSEAVAEPARDDAVVEPAAFGADVESTAVEEVAEPPPLEADAEPAAPAAEIAIVDDAPVIEQSPLIEEPAVTTNENDAAPSTPIVEGEVIDVVVEPVVEMIEALASVDDVAEIVDVTPIPELSPASGDTRLPTSLLDLDAPAFATFAPPPPQEAPPTAPSRKEEPPSPTPQQVDVRKISPDEAPMPIDVQRPLAPARRTAVVPIFADASAGSATSSTPTSSPSSASTDPMGVRRAFTIAELAAAAESIAPAATASTVPASLPATPASPPRDLTLTDLAAAVHGDAGADAPGGDDVTMVPAPTAEVFARSRSTTSARSAALAAQQSVSFRRTIIPILLTLGLIAIALGGGWFALPPDSGLRGDGPAIAVALLCTGPILLGLAALNMLQVRAILRLSSSR